MDTLKSWRTYVFIFLDIVMINIAYRAAFYFRFAYTVPVEYMDNYKRSILVIVIVYIICFYLFKLYDSLWSHASVDEFILAAGGCVTANLCSAAYGYLTGQVLPFGVYFLAGVFIMILVVGIRMSLRVYRNTIMFLTG